MKNQSLLFRLYVIRALVAIALPLLYCIAPACSFGQLASGNNAGDAFSAFDSLSPPPMATVPAPASFAPIKSEASTPVAAPTSAQVEDYYTSKQSEAPTPAAATVKPITGNQFSPTQSQPNQPMQRQQRAPQRELVQRDVIINAEHPFRQYWGVPNGPQTKITGKPITVAELFTGTRSSVVRCQLLHAYWELSGLLAIYHFRCEAEGLADGTQDGMMTMVREQRRTAELEFIKQQWVLAELLRQCKGRTLRESELPIPVDVPLYPRYQTFAEKIARTERTQHLGRMIPIQEQLIESKNGTWNAALGMAQTTTQPYFTLNQRTTAFLDLTKAIIEYNKMIAEYATETIPPNVGQQQLVKAVVRKPSGNPLPVQRQVPQMATTGITLSHYDAPVGIAAESIAQVAYAYQISTGDAMQEEAIEDALDAIEEQKEPIVPDVMQDF